jgi:hypothetical protein
MAVGDVGDFVARQISELPAKWFSAAAPILNAVLTATATAFSSVYSLIVFVKAQARVGTASGGFLDLISLDLFGAALPRLERESDAAFRARILYAMTAPRATRAGVVQMLTLLTGRVPHVFEPSRVTDTGAFASVSSAASGGLLGYDDGSGTAGAGGYGSSVLPFQFFLTVYRPTAGGLANLAGYAAVTSPGAGGGLGGYGSVAAIAASDIGCLVWTGAPQDEGLLTDEQIYDAIAQWIPAGTIAWVYLSN